MICPSSQTQERQSVLPFSKGDHPENVSIDLQDVQKSRKMKVVSPMLIFLKAKNQELEFTVVNIPPGLYRVMIENKDTDGLAEDWKPSKYDNGVTRRN